MYEANVLPLGKLSGGIGMEFGCRLFGRLYEAASAYVIQNTNGEGELCLFDTTFAREVLKRPWPDGAVFALYSNHPEGNMSPMVCRMNSIKGRPQSLKKMALFSWQC